MRKLLLGLAAGLLSSQALAAPPKLIVAISVDQLSQVVLPVSAELGKVGLAFAILGIFAATFGAALETALSAGYTVAQYFGWQWGKYVRPRQAARFHLVVLVAVFVAAVWGMTGVDPVKVTEYSIVLSAAALPLTYFPILVIANDPGYMGEDTNGRMLNMIATIYLFILVLVSVATIPLMIITKAGQ